MKRTELLDALLPGLLELFGEGCPTNREQAKSEGKSFFYDDKRCRNGHFALKKLNGQCTRCMENKRGET
jgi:hypothetical protein